MPSSPHDVVLYILIRYGPDPLLHRFLCCSPLAEREGINPLIYTVPGKVEHAHILLMHGAKLGSSGKFTQPFGFLSDLPSGLPIEAAAESGDSELVDLFLVEGSPVPYKLVSAQYFESLFHHSLGPDAHIFTRLLQTDEFMEWVLQIFGSQLGLS